MLGFRQNRVVNLVGETGHQVQLDGVVFPNSLKQDPVAVYVSVGVRWETLQGCRPWSRGVWEKLSVTHAPCAPGTSVLTSIRRRTRRRPPAGSWSIGELRPLNRTSVIPPGLSTSIVPSG